MYTFKIELYNVNFEDVTNFHRSLKLHIRVRKVTSLILMLVVRKSEFLNTTDFNNLFLFT